MSEGDSHESDILFCPFCGDVDALEVQHLEGAILYPAYRVACDNCGAAFAIRSDIDEWNTRALPAVQPDAAAIREAALRETLVALQGAGSFGETAAEKHSALEQYCMCRDAILALIDKPGHVNETPKREHDARVMLAPDAALFRGPA